jgi:dTDP-4-amino-4,6-dideoxygalactose transaminase
LYLFRIDPKKFGASRDQAVNAVQAEGVPVCGGYAVPLYRQPLFLNKAFGPYIPNVGKRMDYGSVCCPNCEKICYEQGGWMTQNLLLGKKKDMDDIIRAFRKVYENREELMKAL